MNQSIVDHYRVLEQKLSDRFPEVRKEAEVLAAGITDRRTATADVIWEHAWKQAALRQYQGGDRQELGGKTETTHARGLVPLGWRGRFVLHHQGGKGDQD
jgi:hypothetical protein